MKAESGKPERPLLIVGASTRGAAASAVRAGYTPYCIDLFADRDLVEIASVKRCPHDDYPQAIVSLLDRWQKDKQGPTPNTPWIYTGAIENHPTLDFSGISLSCHHGATSDEVFAEPLGPVAWLRTAIGDAVANYRAGIAERRADHPWVARLPASSELELSGWRARPVVRRSRDSARTGSRSRSSATTRAIATSTRSRCQAVSPNVSRTTRRPRR